MTPAEEAAALASYWRQIYSKSQLAPYSWCVQHPLNITEEELLHAQDRLSRRCTRWGLEGAGASDVAIPVPLAEGTLEYWARHDS